MNYSGTMETTETPDTAEAAAAMERIGRQILSVCRDELYFSMRFMDVALSSFVYRMNTKISPFGTDGNTMYFHPRELGGLYKENRILANRGYLHMVLHCVFRHIVKRVPERAVSGQNSGREENGVQILGEAEGSCKDREKRYWDLSCDIAAEHIIDGCDLRPVRWSRSLLRRETYRKLEGTGHVLSAERVFSELLKWELTEKEMVMLEEEFYVDDHRYWESRDDNRPPNEQLNNKWKDIDEKMETDMETFSKEASEQSGHLLGELRAENRDRHDYREFLRKFSVFREELKPDPDTFDYGFYSYGLSLYGNLPLIEPQETREVRKIEEFAVVLDTSMSCSGELVRRFLEETYSVLRENESFFHKVNIHIIQCDEKVHQDVKVTSEEELHDYMDHVQLYGEGGTDFRPAFEYVDELIRRGEFTNLKGLLYFTDGYGIYPDKMPLYRTAFIFLEDDYRDADVPPWAIRLILREEDIRGRKDKGGKQVGY